MFLALSQLNHDVLFVVYHIAVSSPVLSFVAIVFAQWLPYCAIAFVVLHELFFEEEDKTFFQTLKRFALPVFFAWVVAILLKYFIDEPRPFVGELGINPLVSVPDMFGSFPSAHAAVFGALFGAMFFERFRYWRSFGLIAVLVAIGRIATGVHWPSDVLAGIVCGVFVGYLGALFLRAR